jgi:hypothetical protein
LAFALVATGGQAVFAAAPATGELRGRIEDSTTRRPVPGAVVKLLRPAATEQTLKSDTDGTFVFSDLPEGVYTVEVDAPEHVKAFQPGVRVVLNKTAAVEFTLIRAEANAMQEVVVSARAAGEDPRSTPGMVILDREEIRRNPGSTGDIFRALDMLPGVVATGEFSNFTVRGNGPRDNLITIDGIPFDKVTHFDEGLGEQEDIAGGGRYSIFAPNLISSAKFTPGGWRAYEGGKFGSLLELEVAPGNTSSSTLATQFDFGGLEASYDGPSYVADNTSVLFSARNFDFSTLLDAIGENDVGVPRLTDIVFKSVTELNPQHRVELLAIRATEDYYRGVKHALQSENFEDASLGASEQDSNLVGLTWRWSPGDVAQVRNTVYFRNSDKTSSQGESFPDLAGPEPTVQNTPVRPDILRLTEKETELGWRGDFSTVLSNGGIVSAGARVASVELEFDRRLAGDWIRYVYDATDDRPDPSQQFIVLTPDGINSQLNAKETQYAVYADYSHPIGPVTLTPGVRYERDGFSDQSLASPRFSATWQINDSTRAWAGAGVYYQAPRYLDLAADPANARLENERSTQATVGFSRYLGSDLKFTAEGYHQRLSNLIVFSDRTTQFATNSGKGTTSGADLMLNKRMSNGWSASATYSYSRSRRNDQLGEGQYAFDWDRPHAIGLLAAWDISDRWNLSAKWRYASGRPSDSFTIHSDVLAGTGLPYALRYSRESTLKNAERVPAFHSLTVRVDYRRRFGPISVVAFADIVNVYARKNTDSYEWDERRGVNLSDGLDDALPFLGVKFEYSWTKRD